MVISKKVSFDAAHFLPYYEGKCRAVHGHHWVVEVACHGDVNEETGMVVDFLELKEFCGWIVDSFDHKFLNDILGNPTAESICGYIKDKFLRWCKEKDFQYCYTRVWESEDSMVEA